MTESQEQKDAQNDLSFRDAVLGLEHGDFSRMEPLFIEDSSRGHDQCQIIAWYENGYFQNEPKALNEAFTCACFNGRTSVAKFLLEKGVDPIAGDATGMNAFHWAANRGHLDTVRFLIERKVPLELRNMYGGTVLGSTVWSAIHEPMRNPLIVIEALIDAGANLEEAGYPTGNESVDNLLRRHLAKP
jgi:hypothetical protein